MASAKSKVFTGPEFAGTDLLDITDVSDWVVEGFGGETAKPVLDDFDLDRNLVMGITLQTTPDNRKVANSNIFLTGEFMKGNKEVKASHLFPDADKDLRIVYNIEEASIFSFKSGTMIGETLDNDKINWNVVRKTSRGSVEVDFSDHAIHNIGHFSLRSSILD